MGPRMRSRIEMVPDGGERLDVPASVAVDQERLDAGGTRSCEVLGGRVADVKRLPGGAADELERGLEDPRIRLPRSHGRGGDDAVEATAEAAAVEHVGEREVPVGDAHEPQAHATQL